MFDRNRDGMITKEDLSDLLQNFGIFISLWMSMNSNEQNEEDMMEAFNVLHQNKDGFITFEEMRSVLSSLWMKQGRAIEDCKKMIEEVDADGDGRVNFMEFKQMMKGGGFAALRSS